MEEEDLSTLPTWALGLGSSGLEGDAARDHLKQLLQADAVSKAEAGASKMTPGSRERDAQTEQHLLLMAATIVAIAGGSLRCQHLRTCIAPASQGASQVGAQPWHSSCAVLEGRSGRRARRTRQAAVGSDSLDVDWLVVSQFADVVVPELVGALPRLTDRWQVPDKGSQQTLAIFTRLLNSLRRWGLGIACPARMLPVDWMRAGVAADGTTKELNKVKAHLTCSAFLLKFPPFSPTPLTLQCRPIWGNLPLWALSHQPCCHWVAGAALAGAGRAGGCRGGSTSNP